MKKKNINAENVLENIRLKRKQYKVEFDTALYNEKWSQLSGFNGIDIGLMIAEKIIDEEARKKK